MTSPPEAIVELPVDSLLPSLHNQRLKLRGLEKLAASVKEHGVLAPLLVTGNGHETYVMVAGHRRLAAAKMAGLKTVPCIVRTYAERELLATMLVENLQRDDLSPLEEARGYQQLVELKNSTREIARLVGRSQSIVVKRLQLLKLSARSSELYEAGKLTIEDVGVLAALPAERQDLVLQKTTYGSMAQRVRELKWREEETKRQAAEAKRQAAEAKKPKPELRVNPSIARAQSAERKKEKLRKEANAAREKAAPRLLSRGERALQYAAGVVAQSVSSREAQRAGELLKLKPVASHGRSDWSSALFKQAAKSKKSAVDVVLALAIGIAEERIRGTYVGGSPLSQLHITALQSVGYKPNARDKALLKGRRW